MLIKVAPKWTIWSNWKLVWPFEWVRQRLSHTLSWKCVVRLNLDWFDIFISWHCWKKIICKFWMEPTLADGCIRWTDGGHICDSQESAVNRITLQESTLNFSTMKKIINMVFIPLERADVYIHTPKWWTYCDSQESAVNKVTLQQSILNFSTMKQARKLQATLVRNYEPLTYWQE